ncbi:MAG: hypothetical protein H6713_03720 [Myxococcales bacterium]|nr:hypothetical protein [Myxococcales bacterium]
MESFLYSVGAAIVLLLTIGLFITGFEEHNGLYSIAGAIIVGSAILASALRGRG